MHETCYAAGLDAKGVGDLGCSPPAKHGVSSVAFTIAHRLGIFSDHQQAQLQAASSLTRPNQSPEISQQGITADLTSMIQALR